MRQLIFIVVAVILTNVLALLFSHGIVLMELDKRLAIGLSTLVGILAPTVSFFVCYKTIMEKPE